MVCLPGPRAKPAMPDALPLPSAQLQGLLPAAFEQFRPLLDAWLPERSRLIGSDAVLFNCFQQTGRGERRRGRRESVRPRLLVHLVNALRDRRGVPGLRGAAAEQPLLQDQLQVELLLPAGARARRVEWLSPDDPETFRAEFSQEGRRLSFHVPRLLVYGVAVVELK